MTLCTIESVAFGGEGVSRDQGLVIFTPFTLPKEVVEVEIHQKKSNFARAQLKQIVEPSPYRTLPPCSYFTLCGGCQLQHSSYPHQLELKKGFIQDSLARIGKIAFDVPPVIPSASPFAYRRHISMQMQFVENTWQIGFTSNVGTFLPIDSCLLFHHPNDPIIQELQIIVSKLDLSPSAKGRMKILKVEKGYFIAFSFSIKLSKKVLSLLSSCQSLHSVKGVIIQSPNENVALGETSLNFSCEGLTIQYSPFSFLQNNMEQSLCIYKRALEFLQNSSKVLDLYCGIGITSLLLAQNGKQVRGVELNPIAIEQAKENAIKNHLSVEFFCSAAENSVFEHMQDFKPDAALVNPPKTGLDPSVQETLSKALIKEIVYISCHPPTLARDLAFFQKGGFIIEKVEGFDMFPQTTHVETIVHLKR